MDNPTDKDKAAYKDTASYLDSQLTARIASFHDSVKWYRRKYFTTSMSAVILSGLITVLAGWKGELLPGNVIQNVILFLGALTTVVSAWGAFFSPKESWHLYAMTLTKLRALQAELIYKRTPPNEINAEIDKLFERYQAILDEHNRAWLEVRSSIRTESRNTQSI